LVLIGSELPPSSGEAGCIDELTEALPMSVHRSSFLELSCFEEDVIAASDQRPVVLDFCADWCRSCEAVTSTLEDLAEKGNGAFQVVKFDIETDRELAARLGVQGLPEVRVYRGGEVVDAVRGPLAGVQVRALIDRSILGAGQD